MDSTGLITWLTVHFLKQTVVIYFILDPQVNILSTSSSSFRDSPSSFWTAGRLFKNLCVSTYVPANSDVRVQEWCHKKSRKQNSSWLLARWSHSGITNNKTSETHSWIKPTRCCDVFKEFTVFISFRFSATILDWNDAESGVPQHFWLKTQNLWLPSYSGKHR